ncbi:STAS domain protein [Thalassoglobus polymorphus]|uniref:STAS domain protein n=2 Tax=Thalassoglobus polymorphus TaxID=2527994 RepID=A0A517QPY5_9PLAN|nr:STAS domain protein [Thalassoglobus polymorphus]
MSPLIAEGSWADIQKLGDEVTREAQQRKCPTCLIDLSSLDYMGSSLVALLVRIWKDVKEKKGEMVVVAHHPLIRETIVLAGLDKLWAVYTDIDGAYQKIGAPLKNGDTPKNFISILSQRKFTVGIVVLVIVVLSVALFAINQQP